MAESIRRTPQEIIVRHQYVKWARCTCQDWSVDGWQRMNTTQHADLHAQHVAEMLALEGIGDVEEARRKALAEAADIVRSKIRERETPLAITHEDGTVGHFSVGEWGLPDLRIVETVIRNRAEGKTS